MAGLNEQFIQYAMSFVGVPYKWGGENPISGMDCSGLVSECLEAFGIIKGRLTAQGIYQAIRDTSQPNISLPGSIIFFGSSVSHISHIGILTHPQLMLEAGNGGEGIFNQEEADLANAFVRIRPVSRRRDCVSILLPNAFRS